MNTLRVIIQIAGWVGIALAAAGGPTNATIYCLTGNATNAALNLPGVNGSYTYGLANCLKAYNQGDDNGFPMAYVWTSGADCHTNGAPDAGGTNGWIPFNKGSLTGGSGFVAWPSDPFMASAGRLQVVRDIIFDLKQDYYVGMVELDSEIDHAKKYFGDAWKNMRVYVMPDKAEKYTFIGMYCGFGVSKQPEQEENTLTVRNIDSVARFIRIRIETLTGDYGRKLPQGTPPIYEIRIWGAAANGRKGVKPFEYHAGAGTKDLKNLDQYIVPSYAFIYPPPRTITTNAEMFVVEDGTACYLAGLPPETEALFFKEIWENFGVQLRKVSQQQVTGEKRYIAIGLCTNDLIRNMTAQEGAEVTPAKPGQQGYFMLVNKERILINGADAVGAYYGLQNILQLIHRQKVNKDYKIVVDGLRILDWPDQPDRKWACTRNSGPNRIEDPEGLRTYLAIKTRYKQGTYLYFPNPECTAYAPYHPENPAQNDTGLIVKDGKEYYPTEKWGLISKTYIDRAREVAATYGFEYRPFKGPVRKDAKGRVMNRDNYAYGRDGYTAGGPDTFACGSFGHMGWDIALNLVRVAKDWNGPWGSQCQQKGKFVLPIEFARQFGLVKERVYELLSDRAMPGLMRGRELEYFQVDLTSYANLSRVDEKAGDGHGWMDYGPNHDLRNLPWGLIRLCGNIPFNLPGVAQKEAPTAVAIAALDEASMTIGNLPQSQRVAINQKAAALLFLNTSFIRHVPWAHPNAAHVKKGQLACHLCEVRTAMLWPPWYRIVYADGTYELMRLHPWQSRYWIPYYRVDPNYAFFDGFTDFARLAWRGYTDGGEEINLCLQEWVNPCPEKEIAAMEMFFPTELKGDYTHVLLAITGVKPDEVDHGIWKRKRQPLLHQVEDLTIPAERQGRNIFNDLEVSKDEKNSDRRAFYYGRDKSGQIIATISANKFRLGQHWHDGYFPFAWKNFLTNTNNLGALTTGFGVADEKTQQEPIEIRFEKARPVGRIAVRGMMEDAPFLWGGATEQGSMKADVKVEVSGDGKEFQTIKELKGIFGEEGIFQIMLDGKPVKAVRVWLDARPYAGTYDYYAFYPGLTHLGIYEQ